MTNEIQKVREAIELGLVSAQVCPGGPVTEISPCGRYRLEIEEYTTEVADFAVAVVRDMESGQKVVTVKRNDSRCFYGWVSRAGHDYLLFPEDLEGQTVIDLTAGVVAGFSSPDDPYIWTEFHPSPDRTKLAVFGCYWACPYQVTVYDFRDPVDLPLPKLIEFALPGNPAHFGGWVTETAFRVWNEDGADCVFEVPEVKPTEPGAPPDPSGM